MDLTKLNSKNILEERIYEKSFVNWAYLSGLLKRTPPIFLFFYLESCTSLVKHENTISLSETEWEPDISLERGVPDVYKNNGIKRIAVFPFGNEIFTDLFTEKLVNNSKWSVIDRSNLEIILKEQQLQMSGLIDETTAVSIGEIAGLDMVILGEYRTKSVVIKAIDVETAQYLVYENVDLHITSFLENLAGYESTPDTNLKSAFAVTTLLPYEIKFIDGHIDHIYWGENGSWK